MTFSSNISSNLLMAARQINQLSTERTPFLFIFDFELQKPIVLTFSQAATQKVWFNFRGITNINDQSLFKSNNIELSLKKEMLNYQSYAKAFEEVQQHLKRGDSYLLNLTQRVKVFTPNSLAQIFNNVQAPYRLLSEDNFVVFSPEVFIKISDQTISAFPMKGTVSASLPNAKSLLINNQKEVAEHATVVDLLRNDLSMVATNVSVKRFQYIEHIETDQGGLLQSSSQIEGELPANYLTFLGDIICKLLPAGSVSGAPKEETLKIISNVEKMARGYYTGICGIFDGTNLDSAVMIRFIEKIDSEYYFRSGSGITINSDCQSEYQEIMSKVTLPIACQKHNLEKLTAKECHAL